MTIFFTENITILMDLHTPISNLSKTKKNTFLPKSARNPQKEGTEKNQRLNKQELEQRDIR